jgi:hypothetical protein
MKAAAVAAKSMATAAEAMTTATMSAAAVTAAAMAGQSRRGQREKRSDGDRDCQFAQHETLPSGSPAVPFAGQQDKSRRRAIPSLSVIRKRDAHDHFLHPRRLAVNAKMILEKTGA